MSSRNWLANIERARPHRGRTTRAKRTSLVADISGPGVKEFLIGQLGLTLRLMQRQPALSASFSLNLQAAMDLQANYCDRSQGSLTLPIAQARPGSGVSLVVCFHTATLRDLLHLETIAIVPSNGESL